MPSIKQGCNNIVPSQNGVELQRVLAAMLADLTATRAEVVKLVADAAVLKAAHDTLIAKLNLDAGVTDVNYAATAAMTAADPAALTTTA